MVGTGAQEAAYIVCLLSACLYKAGWFVLYYASPSGFLHILSLDRCEPALRPAHYF